MNNLKFSLMNSEIFRGMFDADGSIVVYIREKLGVTGKSIGFQWQFEYEQAHFNEQNAIAIASFFGTEVVMKKRLIGRDAGKTYTVFKTGIKSQAGQALIQIYKDNRPLLSARLKQFRVFEIYQSLKKVGKQHPRETIVMMLRLVHSISSGPRKERVYKYWTTRQTEFNFSSIDIKNGLDKAEKLIKQIEDEVKQLQASLPKTVLSDDYILGFHYSDGSFNAVYKQEKGVVSVIPHWSITTDDRSLLEAFKNTLGGRIQMTGDCPQYILEHQRNII